MADETPDGLHPMQYATHLLEEVLGWPSKGNAEMMADCIISVSKAKKLSHVQSYKYIARAIKLAREQCVEVNRFWFQGGEYMNMRPHPENGLKQYQPAWDKSRTVSEQSTPEWQEASAKAREALKKLAGLKAFPEQNTDTEARRAELRAQAQRMQK